MKKLSLILSLCVASLFSCQDEIDVTLKTGNNQVVLEANLNGESGDFELKASRITDYFTNQASTIEENAIVMVEDASGNKVSIPHSSNGLYKATLQNLVNQEYVVTVEIDNKIYRASGSLKPKVKLDSLYISSIQSPFGTGQSYSVNVSFQDPSVTKNYYLTTINKNGEVLKNDAQFIPINDALSNGSKINRPVYFTDELKKGDTVEVLFKSLDEKAYTYFSSLSQVNSAGPGATVPANPRSNWDNQALGYFAVYSTDKQRAVVE
jgi:Domain of unknown function (DUF4249)